MWSKFNEHVLHDKEVSDFLNSKYEEKAYILRNDLSKYNDYWNYHAEEAQIKIEELEKEKSCNYEMNEMIKCIIPYSKVKYIGAVLKGVKSMDECHRFWSCTDSAYPVRNHN